MNRTSQPQNFPPLPFYVPIAYVHILSKATTPSQSTILNYYFLWYVSILLFLKVKKETEWGKDMNKHNVKLVTMWEGDGGVKTSIKERH